MQQNLLQSWQLIIKLAVRQLIGQKAFALAMIMNMALGLTGFMVVDGFNRSFRAEIAQRTRQIASADIVVSSRQPWTEQIRGKVGTLIPPGGILSEETTIVSMATSHDVSRLVEARFVDANFPLYNGPHLETMGDLPRGPLQNCFQVRLGFTVNFAHSSDSQTAIKLRSEIWNLV